MLRHSFAGSGTAAPQRRAAAAGSRARTRAPGACSSSSSRRSAVTAATANSSSTSSSSSVLTAPAPLRTALAAAAAAVLLIAPGGAWATAPSPLPRADLAELAAVDEDEIIDRYNGDMEDLAQIVDPELAMPPELQDFLTLFSKGTPKDLRKLEDARERVGFRRGADGRVSLLSDGEEFEVKADAQAPGFLLLRDSRGYCYYLPPDPSGRLRQIDLSDDVLVAQLFANGMWQEIVEPVEVLKAPKDGENASASDVVQLRLSEPEWRGVLSMLEGGRELAEEPLEDLQADD